MKSQEKQLKDLIGLLANDFSDLADQLLQINDLAFEQNGVLELLKIHECALAGFTVN
jgi:hypothetical protein